MGQKERQREEFFSLPPLGGVCAKISFSSEKNTTRAKHHLLQNRPKTPGPEINPWAGGDSGIGWRVELCAKECASVIAGTENGTLNVCGPTGPFTRRAGRPNSSVSRNLLCRAGKNAGVLPNSSLPRRRIMRFFWPDNPESVLIPGSFRLPNGPLAFALVALSASYLLGFLQPSAQFFQRPKFGPVSCN